MNEEQMKRIRNKVKRRITRGKAIKLYCKDMCSAGDYQSWKNCEFSACFLFPYRLGKEIPIKQKIASKNDSIRTSEKKKKPSGQITLSI